METTLGITLNKKMKMQEMEQLIQTLELDKQYQSLASKLKYSFQGIVQKESSHYTCSLDSNDDIFPYHPVEEQTTEIPDAEAKHVEKQVQFIQKERLQRILNQPYQPQRIQIPFHEVKVVGRVQWYQKEDQWIRKIYTGLVEGAPCQLLVPLKRHKEMEDIPRLHSDILSYYVDLALHEYYGLQIPLGMSYSQDRIIILEKSYNYSLYLDDVFVDRSIVSLTPIDHMAIVSDAAKTIAYLHSLSIVHGDIRPMHLSVHRVSSSDKAIWTSKLRFVPFQHFTEPSYTSPYDAPEVQQGGKRSFASDIYAFARVVCALLSPDSEATLPPAPEGPLHSILSACLADQPGDRPSAACLCAALHDHFLHLLIPNVAAQQFWRRSFGYQRVTTWHHFANAFFSYLGLDPLEVVAQERYVFQRMRTTLVESCALSDMVYASQFGRFVEWFGPLYANPNYHPPPMLLDAKCLSIATLNPFVCIDPTPVKRPNDAHYLPSYEFVDPSPGEVSPSLAPPGPIPQTCNQTILNQSEPPVDILFHIFQHLSAYDLRFCVARLNKSMFSLVKLYQLSNQCAGSPHLCPLVFLHFSSLVAMPWFKGEVSSLAATKAMRGLSPGHFLVRFSSGNEPLGRFAITRVGRSGKVSHIRIYRDCQHRLYVPKGKRYQNVNDLIAGLAQTLYLTTAVPSHLLPRNHTQ